MAPKKGDDKKKPKDAASKKDDHGKPGSIAETDKKKSSSRGMDRVLRSQSGTKGEANPGEKPKGRKSMVKPGNLTIDDGSEKGEGSGKRKVTKEEGNAGDKEKGKSILRSSDRLRQQSARQGGKIVDEKDKGKGKLVTEEGNAEKAKIPARRKRRADKEIGESSNMPAAHKSSYNLRSRKGQDTEVEIMLDGAPISSLKQKGKAGKKPMRSDGDSVDAEAAKGVEKSKGKKIKLGKETTSTVQTRSGAQSDKSGKTEKKAENVASKKKGSSGVPGAKTKDLQKTKKDGGQPSGEKKKTPARKGQSNAKDKK